MIAILLVAVVAALIAVLLTTELVPHRYRAGTTNGSSYTISTTNFETLGDFFVVPRNMIGVCKRIFGSFHTAFSEDIADRRWKLLFGKDVPADGQNSSSTFKPLAIWTRNHHQATTGQAGSESHIDWDIDLSQHDQRGIKRKGARSNSQYGYGFKIVANASSGFTLIMDAVAEIELEWIGGRGSQKNIDIENGGFDEEENQ